MVNSLSTSIWELQMGVMKNVLKLMEFRFGGRDTEAYRYVKEQVMNYTYEATKKFFIQGTAAGLFERCECGANLRHGWNSCQSCAGSGFRDVIKSE